MIKEKATIGSNDFTGTISVSLRGVSGIDDAVIFAEECGVNFNDIDLIEDVLRIELIKYTDLINNEIKIKFIIPLKSKDDSSKTEVIEFITSIDIIKFMQFALKMNIIIDKYKEGRYSYNKLNIVESMEL